MRLHRLSPPNNWVLFDYDFVVLALAMSMVLTLHLFVWDAQLRGQGRLSAASAYIVVMLLAVTGSLLATRGRAYAVKRMDVRALQQIERVQLCSRVNYFFLLPLIFHLTTWMAREAGYRLITSRPVSPPIPGAAVSNIAVTTFGNPGIEAEESFARYVGSLFWPNVINASLVGLTAVALALYVAVWRSTALARVGEWGIDELTYDGQRDDPRTRLSKGTRHRCLILLQWLTLLPAHVGGIVVVVVGLLWLTDSLPRQEANGWVRELVAPFVWYRIGLESIVGVNAGRGLCILLLVMLWLPATTWMAMWAFSILERLCHIVRLLVPKQQAALGQYELIVRELSAVMGIRAPQLRWSTGIHTPETVAILPWARWCVIRVPTAWALPETQQGFLSKDQIRVVLAHELVHVRDHGRRLWVASLLALLSPLGPGYPLYALLDRRVLEQHADAEAVRLTGQPHALRTLLTASHRDPFDLGDAEPTGSRIRLWWPVRLWWLLAHMYDLMFRRTQPQEEASIRRLRLQTLVDRS